jgi:hypothetical protein
MSRARRVGVLAVLTVAFAIWLFPHWRLRGYAQSTEFWAEDDPGYAFLFTPPAVPSQEQASYWHLEVDWPRQFYELGTLVFLAGFVWALSAGKPERSLNAHDPRSTNCPPVA